MLIRQLVKLIISLIFMKKIYCDEAICTINGKKGLHRISERFLSISIDPAVLLTGLNLSDTSLQLAKHFSPAYIRLAGPSTKYVKYVDSEDKSAEFDCNVVVTPSMWFGINEWLTSANLTPVFGINDVETTKGVWNPKSTLPLLEISDKLNVTCLWQLGYDCSNKTELQYKEDLMILRHILDAFPERKDTWGIIGGDFSKCIENEHGENARRIFDDMEDTLNAIMWEPDNGGGLRLPYKPRVPIWTTAPKTPHPVSFSSAISWAKQIGDAAKSGYEVIFRQPRLHEIFTDTPAYWVSILFKTLMGRNVLDVKATNINSHASIYAHCTKKQNSFVRRGAMTILIVNNGTTNHTALIRFGTPNLRNTEVQSYILTSMNEENTDIYLNDNKLTVDNFNDERLLFIPKLRRAKLMQYLSLTVPPKSIGFFVLPVARVPVCVNEEDEMKLIMDEIRDDQNIPFSEEVSVDILSRSNIKKTPTLREIHQLIEKEMESDEKYYKKIYTSKSAKNKKPGIKIKEDNKENKLIEETINNEIRNFFIERAKLVEKQKKILENDHKKTELVHLLKEKSNKEFEISNNKEKEVDLELSSGEIRKILSDRAKSRAAKKNIKFTSEELAELMNKATEKIMKNSTSIKLLKSAKIKRSSDLTGRNKKDINMRLLNLKTAHKDNYKLLKQRFKKLNNKLINRNRNKRDINMDLLKLKTQKPIKSKFKNQEVKEATLRLPDQASEEFNTQTIQEISEETKEQNLPNGEIFAKLATASSEIFNENKATPKPSITNSLFGLPKPVLPKFGINKLTKTEENKPKKEVAISDQIQIFSESSDEGLDYILEDIDNIPCIHEYFGPKTQIVDTNKGKPLEIWEIGEIPVVDKNSLTLSTQVEETIKKIKQNLKDKPEISIDDDYDDIDSDDKSPLRRKREIPDINNSSNPIDKYYFVIGKPYDPEKIKINENRKNKQIKYLKKRLNKRKKYIEKEQKKTPKTIKKKEKNRNIRSLISENNNIINKKYNSLTNGLKIWKPSDIHTLKQSNTICQSTNIKLKPINDDSIFKSYFNNNNEQQIIKNHKQKRSVPEDIRSVENEIDNFVNEIVKDSPVEIQDNGDYKIILPNKDEIEFTKNETEAEVKFIENTTIETLRNESNIQKIEEKSKESNLFKYLLKDVAQIIYDLTKKLRFVWNV